MRKNEILHVGGEKKEIIKYWGEKRVAGIYTFAGERKRNGKKKMSRERNFRTRI